MFLGSKFSLSRSKRFFLAFFALENFGSENKGWANFRQTFIRPCEFLLVGNNILQKRSIRTKGQKWIKLFLRRRTRTEALTHKSFYSQTLSHTAFTHRRFYTQGPLHTNAFTQSHFYTQTLWHKDAFTHRRLCTHSFTHREAFTHRSFYTGIFTHSYNSLLDT